MLSRPLGNSGLTVSALGLGAGAIGTPRLSEAQVERLLATALERGINFIDTARSYELSEQRLARFLKGRREKVVLATKLGYGVQNVPDWSYDAVRLGIDDARKVLDTDVIDVVLLHSCAVGTLHQGDVIRALHDAKAAGAIRATGYSGENEALRWAVESQQFDVIQCSVNVCDQRCIAWQVDSAARRGMGVVAKRPLANAPWRFAEVPKGEYIEEYWWRWKTIAIEQPDLSPLELALRFSAFTDGVNTAIVGTSDEAHIVECVEAVAKGALSAELYRAIRTAFHSKDPGWWTGRV